MPSATSPSAILTRPDVARSHPLPTRIADLAAQRERGLEGVPGLADPSLQQVHGTEQRLREQNERHPAGTSDGLDRALERGGDRQGGVERRRSLRVPAAPAVDVCLAQRHQPPRREGWLAGVLSVGYGVAQGVETGLDSAGRDRRFAGGDQGVGCCPSPYPWPRSQRAGHRICRTHERR